MTKKEYSGAYRARAEAPIDVTRFIVALSEIDQEAFIFHLDHIDIGLVDVKIYSTLTLSRLRNIAASIEDCHVLEQTIMPLLEYTGERQVC